MNRRRLQATTAGALALGLATILHAGIASAATDRAPVRASAPRQVSYATDVVPILEKRCVRCHGGTDEGEKRVELSLDMTTYEGLMAGSEYGEVIVAGDPDASLLIEMIVAGDMPEEGDPVPPEEIEILQTWIAEGAPNN